jgi:hypothetical protein
MLGFITSTQPARLAITLMTRKAITVLKFNQQDGGDRTFTSQNNRNFKSYRDRGFKV